MRSRADVALTTPSEVGTTLILEVPDAQELDVYVDGALLDSVEAAEPTSAGEESLTYVGGGDGCARTSTD